MMNHRFYILLATSITCFSLTSTPARSSAKTEDIASLVSPVIPCAHICKDELIANNAIANQTSIPPSSAKPILQKGSAGLEVSELQTKLKQIGYYDGVIDGQFGESTRLAVSKFQQSVNLIANGIVDSATWERLDTPKAGQNTATSTEKSLPVAKKSSNKRLLWLLLGTALISSGLTGAIFLLFRAYKKAKEDSPLEPGSEPISTQKEILQLNNYSNSQTDIQLETFNQNSNKSSETVNGNSASVYNDSPSQNDVSASKLSEIKIHAAKDIVSIENTTRLPKVDIVDELIQELQSPELAKRRKAVWALAQHGDSRAVQPLVNMIQQGVNSQEHSLVLEALSQICIRTLKPANNALALSLQDENADVRKNAIRNLTQIYDLVAQITKLIRHATEDTDAEVQQTAHWALSKLSKFRHMSSNESFSKLQNSFNLSDNSYSEPPR